MVGPGAAVIRVWRSSGAGFFCVRNIRFRHAFLGHDHESSVSPVSSQVCAQKPGTDDRSSNGCRSWPEGGQARSAERRTARTYGRRSCSQVRAKEEIERAASIVDAARYGGGCVANVKQPCGRRPPSRRSLAHSGGKSRRKAPSSRRRQVSSSRLHTRCRCRRKCDTSFDASASRAT